jgi:hypothetical protein
MLRKGIKFRFRYILPHIVGRAVIHPPLKNSNRKDKVTEKAMEEAVKLSRQHLRNALLELFKERAIDSVQTLDRELKPK